MTPEAVPPDFVRYLVVTSSAFESKNWELFKFVGKYSFVPLFGRVFSLDNRTIQIGRAKDFQNAIVINDGAISRNHCRLTFSQDRWEVQDLQSRNGTYLNGIKLKSNEPFIFEIEDEIAIPGFSFLTRGEPINSSWFSSNVIELCQSISGCHEWDRLPILSDALKDAGCFEDRVHHACLNPPEDSQTHWVVEWILDQYHQYRLSLLPVTLIERKR
jgi:hypothetical protein